MTRTPLSSSLLPGEGSVIRGGHASHGRDRESRAGMLPQKTHVVGEFVSRRTVFLATHLQKTSR